MVVVEEEEDKEVLNKSTSGVSRQIFHSVLAFRYMPLL